MQTYWMIFFLLFVCIGVIIAFCYVCRNRIWTNEYNNFQSSNISSPLPPQSGFVINGRDTSSLRTAPTLGFGLPVDMPQPELSITAPPGLNAAPPYPVDDTLYPPSSSRHSFERHQDTPIHLSNTSCPYPLDSNLNERPRAPYPVDSDTNIIPPRLNRLPYPVDSTTDNVTPRNPYPPHSPTVGGITYRTPYPPDPNTRVFTPHPDDTSYRVSYPPEFSTNETTDVTRYPLNRAPYPSDTGTYGRTSFQEHTNIVPYPPNRSLVSRDLHATNLVNNDQPPSYNEALRNTKHF